MRAPQRIKVRFFFSGGRGPGPEALVPVFHRWIQQDRFVDHLLLDVADYRHVSNGPSVLLVAHEADIALDLEHHRPGLSYVRKRAWPDDASTLEARLGFCLQRALDVAEAFELEPDLPRLDLEAVEIRLQDRRVLPGSADERGEVALAVRAAVRSHYGEVRVDLETAPGDARRAFGLWATIVAGAPHPPGAHVVA